MQFDFTERVAVITGGAGGIGHAAAACFKANNAQVVLLDRDQAALDRVAAELGVASILLDVTDKAAVTHAIDKIEADHGPIATLVTAAGVLDPPRTTGRASSKAWERVLTTNVNGTRLICEITGTRMAERGQGSIVAIASIAGLEPGPLLLYGPAKAAVMSLTKAYAGLWGRRGVRVNAVAPGYVRTPALERGLASYLVDEKLLIESTAFGRLATVDEVAQTIVFLASDMASGITGAIVPVDAGQLLAGGWAPHGGFVSR